MKRPTLSYANVIATLALFLALGGGAYAATHFPKNSIGAKQLKKNSVVTAKIKNGAVTGPKINLATLGTVPSATHAAIADTLPPAEAIHVIGAPGQPGFLGGSANAAAPGVPLSQAGFYKDHDGTVHLEGIVIVGKGPETVPIFNLPVGFRPANGAIQLYPSGQGTGLFLVAGSSLNASGLSANAGDIIGNHEELVILSGTTFKGE
jgi:hypothetical protein